MSFARDFAHRDALIAAAIDEFDVHGYDKASLNRILEAAGMSKGQLYHHFSSKEGLYLGLCELMVERKRAYFAEHPPDVPAEAGIFEVLRAQLRHGMAFARANPPLDKFARSFLRERGRPIHQLVMTRFDFARNDALQSLVELGRARGELSGDFPAAFVNRIVGHLFNHAAELLDADSIEAFEVDLDHFVTFLKRGLGR